MENSHPAIVSKEMYEEVQQELARRSQKGRRHRGTSIFAGKIICECCGDYFGSKVWHSNSPYRRVIWRCNLKYKGAEKCSTPHMTEQELCEKAVLAMNQLLGSHESILEDCRMIIATLSDTSALDAERDACIDEMRTVEGLMERAVRENACRVLNQADYNERYEMLIARYDDAKDKLARLDAKISNRKARRDELVRFVKSLDKESLLTEFSEPMWIALVDHVTVCIDGKCRFTFRNDSEITV